MLSNRAQKLLQSPTAIVKGMLACAEDPYSDENQSGHLNFGIAENRLIDDLALKVMNQKIELGPEHVHYGALEGSLKLREAFSNFARSNLGIDEIRPEMLAVQSGLSSVCEAMAYAFFDGGDEIITPAPYYSGFAHDFSGRFNVKLAPAYIQERHSIDAIRAAYTKNSKAVLITSPHNPTGEILSPSFLEEVFCFCKEKDLHLITDEIYALSIFNGPSHLSALRVDQEFKKIHFLYGMAKDFGLAGLKTGFYYSRTPEFVHAIQALGYFHPVSSPTQELVANFLNSEAPLAFTQESNRRVKASLDYLIRALPELKIYGRPCAGMFFLADFRFALSKYESEQGIYDHLLKNLKINLTPGKSMGMNEEGLFRVCFARPKEELQEFSRRLSSFLKD